MITVNNAKEFSRPAFALHIVTAVSAPEFVNLWNRCCSCRCLEICLNPPSLLDLGSSGACPELQAGNSLPSWVQDLCRPTKNRLLGTHLRILQVFLAFLQGTQLKICLFVCFFSFHCVYCFYKLLPGATMI
uniref:Uncharacterized protein n=1 Tax=Physcomitrium patens TaxID=3218 RepID=A0A2K1J8J7_PHYPA|nr:hypothetical protein PHYPA_020955 [Physcomitrium patens]